MWAGYKFAIDPESKSLYAAQITSSNYLSGISSSDYFRVSQSVFLVSSLVNLNNVSTSGAGLYIDYNGESQYFDGSGWIDTSHEVVTELTSSATNDTLPTTKAVYDYINTEILKIQTGNGDITDLLDGKADVAYVDEQDKNVLSSAQAYTNIQVSGKADKSDIIGLASENYVLSSINNAFNDIDLSNYATVSQLDNLVSKTEIAQDFINITSAVIPSVKAVSEYVSSKIAEIPEEISEVYYISGFTGFTPEATATGLYVDFDGQSKLWTGSEWEETSHEIVTDMFTSLDNNTVPTTNAVANYVNEKTLDFVTNNVLSTANQEILTAANTYTNKAVSSKLNSSEFTAFKTNINTQLSSIITYTNAAVSSKLNSSDFEDFKLRYSEDQEIIWDQLDYTGLQLEKKLDKTEITDTIDTIEQEEDKIPTVKAVYDFVNGEISTISSIISEKPEVFYIQTFENYNPTVSGFYIDYNGETRFWDEENGWEQTSHEIVSEIKQYSNNVTVPTTNAVSTFVTQQIQALPKGGNPEVFYIDSFEEIDEDYLSGIYITANGETAFWTGTGLELTSYFMVDDIDLLDDSEEGEFIPSVKAVKNYVANHNVPSGNQIISGGAQEVFYIQTFENYNPTVSGFYIDHEGRTRYWDGSDWEQTSKRIIDSLYGTILSGDVATAKAVKKYVDDNTGNINGGGSVSVRDEFPISGQSSTIYINKTTNEAKYYDEYWKNLSIKAITNMTGNQLQNVVPTTQAVANYTQSKLSAVAEIEILSSLPETGDENVLYIAENGEVGIKINDEIKNISVDVVDDIASDGTDMNIPTCVAVKNYIDLLLNGNTVTDTINSIIDMTASTNTYYKFTQKLTSLSLILNSGLRNVTIEFSTGSSFTYDVSVNGKFKISKQFEFETDKNYVIAINNDLIIWSEVEEYV